MNLVIKKPKFDIWTIILAAYLVNQFYFSNAVSIQRLLLLGILIIYIFIHLPYIKCLLNTSGKRKAFIGCVSGFLIWLLFVAITPIISGTFDFSYLSYCMTFISWFMYLFTIVIRVRKKYPNIDIFDAFMHLFILSMVLYVISTIIILLIPSLRTLVNAGISQSYTQLNLQQMEKYYTRIGWAGFSGYTTSLKCTLAICFQLYFMMKKINSNKRIQLKDYIVYILLMIGNVFYARTGMLISLVCTIVAVFGIAIILNKFVSFLKYFGLLVIISAIVIVILNAYSGENPVLDWILELFINYENGRGISTISTEIIFNQMLFKIDNSTLFMGDGYYTSPYGGYYMSTDLGFMRLLLYFGIPGTALIYGVYLRSIRMLGTICNSNYIKSLSVFLLIIFLGFEFKGESIVILIPVVLILLLTLNNDRLRDSLVYD